MGIDTYLTYSTYSTYLTKSQTKTLTFEDLAVWQRCRALREKVSNLVKSFPKDEQFRLVDQMIRAARSSTANIAEGYGRYHYKENIQFCRQARDSLYELLDHLTVALDERYIDREKFEEFRTEVLESVKILNRYIKYLQRKKNDDDRQPTRPTQPT